MCAPFVYDVPGRGCDKSREGDDKETCGGVHSASVIAILEVHLIGSASKGPILFVIAFVSFPYFCPFLRSSKSSADHEADKSAMELLVSCRKPRYSCHLQY